MDKSEATTNPCTVAGIRLGTTCAGIRKPQHPDLVVMEIVSGASCAAVFTRNAFCAAPVSLAQEHLKKNSPRYLLINTGYANAGTGAPGLQVSRECCEALAELAGCSDTQVLPFSTGIIGEPLPLQAIVDGMPDALAALDESGWSRAAQGIMTTDTVPKLATRRISINDRELVITGMAKGSGMIRPDMATMLAFIATDASIEQDLLQQCLNEVVDKSFNRITVDGDTSTNDACVLLATGQGAEVDLATDGTVREQFVTALSELCQELAKGIIRDGEGATKLVTVRIEGGKEQSECSRAAYTVAHSPLVKTALFAEDPNWGRILAALGRAGISDFDISRVNIYLGDVCIVKGGARAAGYTEQQGVMAMTKKEIVIRVELGRGEASDTVWTCDLSYDYVRINADYRT